MTRQLDDTDRTLLRALGEDGRRTVRALAQAVGLSEPAVHDRLRRLERSGVIVGYHVAVDPEAVDAATAAFVAVRFSTEHLAKSRIDEELRGMPCVLEAHEVAGEDCYLVKVRVSSPRALSAALDRIRALPSVDSTRTTIALRTIFERPLLTPTQAPVTPSPCGDTLQDR